MAQSENEWGSVWESCYGTGQVLDHLDTVEHGLTQYDDMFENLYRRRALTRTGDTLRKIKFFRGWQVAWHQARLFRKLRCLRGFRKWMHFWLASNREHRRNQLLDGPTFTKLPLVRAVAFSTWRVSVMQVAMAQVSFQRMAQSWKKDKFRAWKRWFQMEQFFKSRMKQRFLRQWISEMDRLRQIKDVLPRKVWLKVPLVRQEVFQIWHTYSRISAWRAKMHMQIKGEMWYEWRHYVAMERYFKLRMQQRFWRKYRARIHELIRMRSKIFRALDTPLFVMKLPLMRQDMATCFQRLVDNLNNWRRALKLLASKYLRYKGLCFRTMHINARVEKMGRRVGFKRIATRFIAIAGGQARQKKGIHTIIRFFLRSRAESVWAKWRAVISVSYRDKLRKLLAGLKGTGDAVMKRCFSDVINNGAISIAVPDQQLGRASHRAKIKQLTDFLLINHEEQENKRYFSITPMTSPIVHLDLARNELGISGGRVIAKALSQNTVIQSCNLAENRLTGDLQLPCFHAVLAIGDCLRTNTSLTLLNLSRNNLGGWADKSGVDALAKGLKSNQALTALNVGQNRLNDIDLSRLTPGVRGVRRQIMRDVELRMNLNLAGNPLTGPMGSAYGGLERLCACLCFDRMRVLNLSNCRLCGVYSLGPRGPKRQSGGGTGGRGRALRSASVSGTKSSSSAAGPMLGRYSTQALEHLAAAVRTTSTLTSLNVSSNFICLRDGSSSSSGSSGSGSGNQVTDQEKEALGSSSSSAPLPPGENKDPSSADDGDGGCAMHFLASMLRADCSLLQFDLSDNCMGAADMGVLARALPTNDTLTALDLHNNEFGADGALALANGLAENVALRTVNLNGTRIGKSGCTRINTVLNSNNNTKRSKRTLDATRMEMRLRIMEKQMHRGRGGTQTAVSLDDFDYM